MENPEERGLWFEERWGQSEHAGGVPRLSDIRGLPWCVRKSGVATLPLIAGESSSYRTTAIDLALEPAWDSESEPEGPPNERSIYSNSIARVEKENDTRVAVIRGHNFEI